MTHHDFEKALAALKNAKQWPKPGATGQIVGMERYCVRIDDVDGDFFFTITAALQAAIAQPVGVEGLDEALALYEKDGVLYDNEDHNDRMCEPLYKAARLYQQGKTAPVQNETGRDLLDLMRETVIYSDHAEMPIRTYEAMKAALQQPAQGVDYIRKDIVPQDQMMKALEALNEAQECFQPETLEELRDHFETIRALLVAHVGDQQ